MFSNVSLFDSNYLSLARSSASTEISTPSESKEGSAAPKSENNSPVKDKNDISKESKIKSENSTSSQELTEDEEKEVKELKKIDAEVRRHEQAHLSAGGSLVRGGATFQYQRGPDGQQYAVGGEVNIDTSPEKGDPEATIQKMQQVKRAALAPAEPSAQDRSVASRASATESQARSEMLSEKSKSNDDNEDQENGNISVGSEAPKQDIKSINTDNDSDNNIDISKKDDKQNNSFANASGFASLKQKYLDPNSYSGAINAYA